MIGGVRERWESVRGELQVLKCRREEIELADQFELQKVREEISVVSEGINTRKAELERQKQSAVTLAEEEKEVRRRIEECKERILKAEKVKEMNRGFEKGEVDLFKGVLHVSCSHR